MIIEGEKPTQQHSGFRLGARPHWMEILVAGGIVGVLSIFFLPHSEQQRGDWPSCQNYLKQIMIALENYHDIYGCYPPAYVADKSGRPMHSWRVLILPHMEAKFVYDQYRMDEPWNSPHNLQLDEQLPRFYSCHYDHERKPSTETSFVAVIGPDTLWPGEQSVRRSDIKDGAGNVIAVVEVHDSGIHWMEPRDLHVLQMSPTINAAHGQGISSAHRESANVAFADGMVRRLPQSTPANELRNWINIADGTLGNPSDP